MFDAAAPSYIATHDLRVAELYRRFLELVFDHPAIGDTPSTLLRNHPSLSARTLGRKG